MADDDELDDLLTQIVGVALEGVRTSEDSDWAAVIRSAHASITEQVIEIVSSLDGDPLRALTAPLLHKAAAAHLEELMAATFPHLLLPQSEN